MSGRISDGDELIGVFGDVHGNLPAMRAVLDEFDSAGVDRVICLGDILGLYGWCDDCCQLAREECDVVVLGNHDRRVFSEVEFNPSKPKNIAEMRLVPERIGGDTLRWLQDVPEFVRLDDIGVQVTHAHPDPELRWTDADTVPPEDYSDELAKYCNGDVLLLGHTHIRGVCDLGSDGLILNPGACGTPWKDEAKYALVEPKTQSYQFHQVEYDTDEVRQRLEELEVLSVAP